jgi:hypothetical protein
MVSAGTSGGEKLGPIVLARVMPHPKGKMW